MELYRDFSVGGRKEGKYYEHILELQRRIRSSLCREPAPVIVLEYDGTRRGYFCEEIIN